MNIDGEVVQCPHANHTSLSRCASDRRVIDERVYFAERDAADARSNRVHGRIMAAFVLALFALAAWSTIRDAIPGRPLRRRPAAAGRRLPRRVGQPTRRGRAPARITSACAAGSSTTPRYVTASTWPTVWLPRPGACLSRQKTPTARPHHPT